MRFDTLGSGYLPELGRLHAGKVRDSHVRGDERILVASDRVSAFDNVLSKLIPEKGAVLNAIAMWWFRQMEDVMPNHVIANPDPNVTIGRQAEVLPIEIVVRQYITGSAWKAVQSGAFEGMYGFEITPDMIEDGELQKNCKLTKPIFTPTTKAHDGHDEPLTADAARQLVGSDYDEIVQKAFELFERGSKLAEERGLILVDTKYEFGRLDGKLILVDEVHTPDSSRYWRSSDYAPGAEIEELSKQFVRDIVEKQELSDADVEETSRRYIALYEMITGESWQSTSTEVTPQQRVVNNLIQSGHIRGGFLQTIAGSEVDDWHIEKLQSEMDLKNIPYDHLVCSAHKKTHELLDFIDELNRSIEPVVIITVAGGSDALSGVIAHHAKWPVIACPPYKDEVSYSLNVHSTIQMPSLVPALYCKRPGNAIQAAERILTSNNPKFSQRLAG